MKKVIVSGLVLVLALLFVPLRGTAGSLTFRAYGGGTYLMGGDLNRGLQGWADYWKAVRNSSGYTQQTGSFNPVHIGFEVGGDIILHLSPNWGLGVGTEYLMATKSTAMAFQSTTQTLNWSFLGEPSAVPVKLSVFHSIPVGDSLTISLHVGAGYYFARVRLESLQDVNPNVEYIIDSRAEGLGFHGGLGLEMKILPGVNFLVEAAGRSASLSGFEGTTTIVGQSGWDGKLYYWEATTSVISNYGYIDLIGGPPSGSAIKFVRDAKIDFSGVSLRAGIVVKI